MDTSSQEAIVRALRRLTIAVWALTAVGAAYVALYIAAWVPYLSSMEIPSREVQRSSGAPAATPADRFEKFYEMPIEKQVAAASVIALARYQKDGDRVRCVISEILKQTPNTTFHYKIGDEYRQCSYYPNSEADRGDGQVMFFVGSPAEFRYSTTFRGDRLSGQGDMPFDLLKKLIRETK